MTWKTCNIEYQITPRACFREHPENILISKTFIHFPSDLSSPRNTSRLSCPLSYVMFTCARALFLIKINDTAARDRGTKFSVNISFPVGVFITKAALSFGDISRPI